MTDKIYWKVITRDGRKSALAHRHGIGLEYPVGVLVIPKIPSSKLMVFNNREIAESFAINNSTLPTFDGGNDLIAVRCNIKMATGCSINEVLFLPNVLPKDVKYFWENPNSRYFSDHERIYVLIGTVFADEVTCLE